MRGRWLPPDAKLVTAFHGRITEGQDNIRDRVVIALPELRCQLEASLAYDARAFEPQIAIVAEIHLVESCVGLPVAHDRHVRAKQGAGI